MARKACTPPFPTLNPNPSRSFLSCGRGDYPKGYCVPGLVRCPRSLYAFHKQHHQQPQDKQRNDAVLRHPDSAPAFEKQFHVQSIENSRHRATPLWCYKIILWVKNPRDDQAFHSQLKLAWRRCRPDLAAGAQKSPSLGGHELREHGKCSAVGQAGRESPRSFSISSP